VLWVLALEVRVCEVDVLDCMGYKFVPFHLEAHNLFEIFKEID
jgi:hypothetical protein